MIAIITTSLIIILAVVIARGLSVRETEALGIFDDHDGGIRDIDTDFDDRGGEKDLHTVRAEGENAADATRNGADADGNSAN